MKTFEMPEIELAIQETAKNMSAEFGHVLSAFTDAFKGIPFSNINPPERSAYQANIRRQLSDIQKSIPLVHASASILHSHIQKLEREAGRIIS